MGGSPLRSHLSNIFSDVMGINGFGSRVSFTQSLKRIDEGGEGIILLLSQKETDQQPNIFGHSHLVSYIT